MKEDEGTDGTIAWSLEMNVASLLAGMVSFTCDLVEPPLHLFGGIEKARKQVCESQVSRWLKDVSSLAAAALR